MEVLLAHCQAAFSQHGNIFLAFLLGGFAGSITHCLSMCAPLVACQAACGAKCGGKMTTASQWQYHAGRFVVYGALGFASAYFSKYLANYSFWPMLSAVLMVLAGLLFIGSGVFQAKHTFFNHFSKSQFLRGGLMSFMPCGLLYAALLMAATIADGMSGMIAMWFFVLGTLPVLLLASGTAALFARKWNGALNRLGRIGLTCNGLGLIAMATQLVR